MENLIFCLNATIPIFQTRSKSRVNSNKIADSGVVDHEVWKDKDL